MARPFALHFTVAGERDVEHRLLGISDRAVDLKPALQEVATLMRKYEAELFDAEGHGTWPPLSVSTVEAKAARSLDPRILHATLALRSSLTEEGGDHVEVITADELHFSTSVEYAGYHKTGTSRMPKRDPLQFSESQVRNFTREVQRYLVGEDAAAVEAGGGGAIPPGLA